MPHAHDGRAMRRLAHAWCVAFVVLLLGQTTVPLWHHHDAVGSTCAHAEHSCPATDHDFGTDEADDVDGGEDPDAGDDCVICESLAASEHIVLAAPIPVVVVVVAAEVRVPPAERTVVQGQRFGRPHPRGPPLDS